MDVQNVGERIAASIQAQKAVRDAARQVAGAQPTPTEQAPAGGVS